MACDECQGGKAGGAASGAPKGPQGDPGDPPRGERAFKIYSRRAKVGGGTAVAQIVASVPPAAAFDVLIRYRDDSGNVEDPFGSLERWTITAVTQTTRSQIGPFRITSDAEVSDSGGEARRIFAIRDIPAETFELAMIPTGVPAGSIAMFDVVIVAWGREPTGIGPFELRTVRDGGVAASDISSIAILGADQASATLTWRALTFNNTAIYNPPVEGSTDGRTNLNVLPVGQFRTVAPALANNDLLPLQLDAAGNLKVATTAVAPAAANRFTSPAYQSNRVRVGAATLRSAFVSSKALAAGFLFVFDAAALPADGTLPDFPPIPIPVGPSFASLDLAEGRSMAAGIVLAFSSTQAVLTIATADCWFEGHIS